jgi:hypothetical protein
MLHSAGACLVQAAVQLDHRKVGYTLNAAYMAGTLADPWQRQEENSAFYGSFTF